MSAIYDNWERLVDAVIRREQIWQLCHQDSRTPSFRSSVSSTSSFRLSSSFSRASFKFSNQEDGFFKTTHSLAFRNLAQVKISFNLENNEVGQLLLFKGTPFAFGLQELLMAPSFVLGDELTTYRSTYIVRLKEDILLVVKRLERGRMTHEVFEQRLKFIGRIEHENVAKLRGYFLSKEECFGFYDYFPHGSVYTMLHGKKGENQISLDWEGRTRIAIGAAKGLAEIHRQRSGMQSQGSIKASNILLNSKQYGCISDIRPATFRISKYHPLEVLLAKRVSMASDVYSFGVLLIELLSGRSPLHFVGRRGETFVDWAIHHARDDWTGLVFDKGLLRNQLVKQAMWGMLAVALHCVKNKPVDRPNMEDVVHMPNLESLSIFCCDI